MGDIVLEQIWNKLCEMDSKMSEMGKDIKDLKSDMAGVKKSIREISIDLKYFDQRIGENSREIHRMKSY